MINEDYVSFETAKLLKEKGFDTPVKYFFNQDGLYCAGASSYNWNDDKDIDDGCEDFSRPTLQMAMKWLREEKRCIIVIIPKWFTSYGCTKYAYSIWADDNLEIDGETNKDTEYDTYEEACEAAIKYCLEKLI